MEQMNKRVKWKNGYVYALPLTDGSYSVAQAIDSMMPNIGYCAVFNYRFSCFPPSVPALNKRNIIALLAVTKVSIKIERWSILGEATLAAKKKDFPNERFARKGYVGSVTYDSGLIEDLVSGYYALIPWNALFEETFYDEMLLHGIKRPTSVVILSVEERQKYRENILGIKTSDN